MINILVVEDDKNLNKIACSNLISEGYNVFSAYSGNIALDILYSEKIDIILSDIMMEEIDGFELAKEIREYDKSVPILFMTAKDDINDKRKGYDIGIDDYMVKPIDMSELKMRVSALLRRYNIVQSKKLEVGSLVLSEEETAAYVLNEDILLTVKEFKILFKLLSYPKKTFTRVQLMDEFWGFDSESNPRTVDVSITKLREKIANCKEVEIITVRGLGYKAVIKVES